MSDEIPLPRRENSPQFNQVHGIDLLPNGAIDGSAWPNRRYGRLNVYTLGDEVAQLERPYLLKGLIYKGDLIFFTGEPGSGKTTLAQYIALAVAQGRSIFGRRVNQGRVLYLAFEGKSLFLQKMKVFENKFGSSRDLVYLTQTLELVTEGIKSEDASLLRQIVLKEQVDMIVCDTWSKMMAGANDSTHQDTSSLIRVLDVIREESGAAIVVIAHPNRTNPSDVSGSLTVKKDCDALICVSGTSGTRTVESIKLRFDRCGPEFSFALNRVVLGVDTDGDEVASVDLEEVFDEQQRRRTPPKLSEFQRILLKEVTNLLASTDHTKLDAVPREGMPRVKAVRREALNRELQINGRLESKSGEALTTKDRGKIRDALVSLEIKGIICSTESWVWKP